MELSLKLLFLNITIFKVSHRGVSMSSTTNEPWHEKTNVSVCHEKTLLSLKIRSRSPKSNHSFWLSQISICTSLVHIPQMVHKLDCTLIGSIPPFWRGEQHDCCQFWVNKDKHTNTYFADVASSDLALTSNSSDWAFSSSENIQKKFFWVFIVYQSK